MSLDVPDRVIARLEAKIDQLLGDHDEIEQRVSELERWRKEEADPQLELAREGAKERTEMLKDIQNTLDEMWPILEPWKRREHWWQKTREFTVDGVTVSYWLLTKIGIAATSIIAIALVILWLTGTIDVPR